MPNVAQGTSRQFTCFRVLGLCDEASFRNLCSEHPAAAKEQKRVSGSIIMVPTFCAR